MKPVQHILQDNYLSVIVGERPFSLNSSHPTFAAMKRALERKNWASIPRLVNIAESIKNQTQGSIKMEGGKVFYKGRQVDNSLTRRIVQLVKDSKPVKSMLVFMDNLYKNPDEKAINELYDWLMRCNLPITDDGCFMAYKAVRSDYKDKHTNTLDNSVGNVLSMPRKAVDANRANECSHGLHFCSLNYVKSFYGNGDKLVGVKVNPKDVVSIPADYNYSKGRTWRYEVVMEIADADPVIQGTADSVIFQTAVLPVESDRKKLLEKVLAHPTVRRALKKRKLKVGNLKKGTLGRLTKLYARLPIKSAAPQSKLFENPIKVAREQAGLRLIEVAEEMDITSKEVYDAERFANVTQTKVDALLSAIEVVAARKANTLTTYAKA
jgi:hypothetical protein